jgi:hypothetical protein
MVGLRARRQESRTLEEEANMRSQPTILRRLAWVVLALVALAMPARTADHRDGPRIAQNTPTLGNIDINDVYIFRSPHSTQRTVMIMTLSAAAGVIGPAQFDPSAGYEFRIDNTGDAVTDVVFQVAFSEPNARGRQSYSVRLMTAANDTIIGQGMTSIGSDKQVRKTPLHHGGMVTAGLFDDPFFFDLIAFNKFIALADSGAPLAARVAPFLPPNIPNDFFGDFNALAIVMEVPDGFLRSSPSNSKISLFCRTVAEVGDGRGFAQYDRMGIPAINTAVIQPGMPRGTPPNPPGEVFPPGSTLDEDNFNFGDPSTDSTLRSIASARIQFAYGVSASYADGIAAFVLPDALPFDLRSSKGFPNGRQLDDDVIDIEFDLLTAGALTSDRVINDSVFRKSFPYLGAPLPRAPTALALQGNEEADVLALPDELLPSVGLPRPTAMGRPPLRGAGGRPERRPGRNGASHAGARRPREDARKSSTPGHRKDAKGPHERPDASKARRPEAKGPHERPDASKDHHRPEDKKKK